LSVEPIGALVQQSGSLEPVHQTPFALGAASGLDGALDVRRVGVGNFGDHLFCSGVLDLDRSC
jgi:hypothetical protein